MPVVERVRCAWARTPASIAYHDTEWGVPQHDDVRLFELLVLEGAQAGLSWETILAKRTRYRAVFDGFDVERVARYGDADVARLLGDAGIVRNRAKILAAIGNAKSVLAIAALTGSFDAYLWAFVSGTPIVNRPRDRDALPGTTPLAETLSKDLRRHGCRFVGPTIVYAFMQAAGLVDDHVAGCFRAAPAASTAERHEHHERQGEGIELT